MADPQEDARREGYSWGDIWDHIISGTQEALGMGYSQADVDQHLGYTDRSNENEASWREYYAANPDVHTDGVDLTDNPNFRSDYAASLRENATKNPLDFAYQYAASALNALGIKGDDDVKKASWAADTASNDLPHTEDLVDATVVLDPDKEHPQTRQNLIDHWLQTGQDPAEAAMQAQTDSHLHEKLTQGPNVTPEPSWFSEVLDNPHVKAFTSGLVSAGADAVGMAVDTMMPAMTSLYNAALEKLPEELPANSKLAVAVEQMRQHPLLQSFPGGSNWWNDVLTQYTNLPTTENVKPEGFWDNAIQKMTEFGAGLLIPAGVEAAGGKAIRALFPELMEIPKAHFIDPANPGTVKEVPINEAFNPVEPAKLIQPEAVEGKPAEPPKLDPEASPEAKIAYVGQEATPKDLETGTFFQDQLEKLGETDPQAVALAEGHDTAWSTFGYLRNLFTDLLYDERGTLQLVKPSKQVEPSPAMSYAEELKAKELVRESLLDNNAFGERQNIFVGQQLEKMRHAYNPLQKEFNEAVGADRFDTQLGKFIRATEGYTTYLEPGTGRFPVRKVALVAKNSPLAPYVNNVRSMNEEINKLVEVRRPFDPKSKDPPLFWSKLWKDENQARRAWEENKVDLQEFGQTRAPRISDGLKWGLEPKTTDFLDLTLLDLTNKERWLRKEYNIDHLTGIDVFHPSKEAPVQGMERLQDVNRGGMPVWAPKGAARLFNNAMNAGWYHEPNDLMRTLMKWKNRSVGNQLMIPLFHSAVIGEQTVASALQTFISETGGLLLGRKEASYAKAFKAAKAGWASMADYTGKQNNKILDMLMTVGGRYGARQGPYQLSQKGVFALAQHNRGRVFESAMDEIKSNPVRALGTAYSAPLTSVSSYLFDYTIPHMKLSIGYTRLEQYIRLHPNASEEQVLTRARQIVENLEDRFGEMNMNNLFWNKWFKNTANMASISTSWAFGTWRWFASALGYNMERTHLFHASTWEFNPEATGSLVTSLVAYLGANGILNYFNTGEMPKDIWDLLNFRTGATDKYGQPQRGLIPTEFKELYDIGRIVVDQYAKGWHDPFNIAQGLFHYLAAKENPILRAFDAALISGKDPIDHDIARTPGGWPGYFLDMIKPLILKNVQQSGLHQGLNLIERMIGMREAPNWLQHTKVYLDQELARLDRSTKAELSRAGREAIDRGEQPPAGYKAPKTQRGYRGAKDTTADFNFATRAQAEARASRASFGERSQGVTPWVRPELRNAERRAGALAAQQRQEQTPGGVRIARGGGAGTFHGPAGIAERFGGAGNFRNLPPWMRAGAAAHQRSLDRRAARARALSIGGGAQGIGAGAQGV